MNTVLDFNSSINLMIEELITHGIYKHNDGRQLYECTAKEIENLHVVLKEKGEKSYGY